MKRKEKKVNQEDTRERRTKGNKMRGRKKEDEGSKEVRRGLESRK